MRRRIRVARLASVTAFVVATSAAAGVGGLVNGSGAHADPAWGTQAATSTPLVGMGADTLADLFNAYSGEEPSPGLATINAFRLSEAQVEAATHFYTPLHDNNGLVGGNGSDNQVYSWDALSPFSGAVDCVDAKAGFPNMVRPNGSGNGKTAMSDAITGVAWGSTASTCGSDDHNPQGELDFVPSSIGPGQTCTPVYTGTVNPCLVYVDFAHDAVPYAYYAPSVANATPGNPANPVDHLTTGLLNEIFASTPSAPVDLVGGLTVVPCMPQQGSGTGDFFAGKIGDFGGPPTLADTDAGLWQCGGTFESNVAAVCAPAAPAPPCSLEENSAISFEQFAANDLSTGFNGLVSGHTVFVIPFSAGSLISQENGVALDRSSADIQTISSGTGVGFGVEDGVAGNVPYTGTITGAPPQALSPSGTALTGFEGGNYGRDLFVVTDNKMLNGPLGQNNKTFRGLFGFAGTSTGALADTTSATTGTGAICQGAGTSTTPPPAPSTVATNPTTIVGPAQSYLAAFGFVSTLTAAGASNCGAETTVLLAPGTGRS